MLIEHGGKRPAVDRTAWVAPNAVLSGEVSVGPRARILYGAILTAENGSRISVGAEAVEMEHVVLRAAGPFPLTLVAHCLVGPHAYLTGCEISDCCFIATGAMVFNGAFLGDACVVALGGKVHVKSELAPGSRVPIGYIAIGRPAQVYRPDDASLVHEELARIDFMRYVFGLDAGGKSRHEVMEEALTLYSRSLASHEDDVSL